MNKKATGIVAFISWIGFIIAVCAGDKKANFHVNQALVIMLFSLLSFIPVLGWFWGIFMTVCWFMGLIRAINEEEKPVPLIGKITIIKPVVEAEPSAEVAAGLEE